VGEATALLEKLSDADWKKTTAAEKWTVAVTAHHIARSYEPVTHIIKTIAAGESRENVDQPTERSWCAPQASSNSQPLADEGAFA
jgi:hypothetical protein